MREKGDLVSNGVIAYRLGRVGAGLEPVLKQMAPDTEVVEWPTPSEILVTLDSAWDGTESDLAAELRWIHILSAGVGNFPVALLEGRALTCGKGASAVAIAEFALATMLAFEKGLPETWVTEPPPRWGFAQLGGLRGKTLGLVGLGAIGTEIAKRALGFDMRVVALRRSGRPSDLAGVEVASSLIDVLDGADHVVVAAPATRQTYHLIDADALAAMKDGVHLVNVARGSLIDQGALIDALDRGKVGMASLDVAEPEPLPAGHVLYSHPRVRLSPHISYSSADSLNNMLGRFADNLARYRAGQSLEGLVDVEAGY